jgi:hypothetical protein
MPTRESEFGQLAVETRQAGRAVVARLTRMLDALAAQEGRAQQETTLSLIGALLLVPGLVAAVMGANVIFPLQQSRSGWLVLIALATQASALALFLLLGIQHDWTTRRTKMHLSGRPRRDWDGRIWRHKRSRTSSSMTDETERSHRGIGYEFAAVPGFIGLGLGFGAVALFSRPDGLFRLPEGPPGTTTTLLVATTVLSLLAIAAVADGTLRQLSGAESPTSRGTGVSALQIAIGLATSALAAGFLLA